MSEDRFSPFKDKTLERNVNDGGAPPELVSYLREMYLKIKSSYRSKRGVLAKISLLGHIHLRMLPAYSVISQSSNLTYGILNFGNSRGKSDICSESL